LSPAAIGGLAAGIVGGFIVIGLVLAWWLRRQILSRMSDERDQAHPVQVRLGPPKEGDQEIPGTPRDPDYQSEAGGRLSRNYPL